MSRLKTHFLEIFNKQGFDYTDPVVTLNTFHPQLYAGLALNGLWFSNRDSMLRFLWPLQSIVVGFLAVTLQSMAMSHAITLEDPALFTEAFAYCVIIGVIPALYFSLLRDPQKIYALVETLNNDIKFICNDIGDPYKTKFLEGQLLIWQYGILWFVFVTFVAAMYILLSIFAVMYYCLIVTHDEESEKPLIFPIWLPRGDPHASPLYESLMFLMYLAIVDFVTTFTAYVYIVFHFWLHAYYMIDMVILGLEHLFDDLDERVLVLDHDDDQYTECQQELRKRIKRIVTWHNSVFKLVDDTVDVFGATLAYQVVFSSIVLCLMAFYITVQLENGNIDICIMLLAVGAVLQLWIPCYIGSLLRTKGFEVADKCFYSGWHATKLVRLVLTDLTLIIVRSQRPISIQVTCLPALQLETFSSILSTNYSYFNMLQQK